MRIEHKAIIEKAKREGLQPMEMAAELLVHDMVLATREEMCRFEVGFRKMTEKQQDTVLNSLQDKYKAIALTAARVIASGGAPTVPMTLKDLKIANGTLTGIVNGGEDNFNELISKVQDKSEVLLVLYPREFDAGLNAIQPEKDQKDLDLAEASQAKKGASKPKAETSSKKEIELTPGQIEQARDFVTRQQNATHAGLQNFLKCNFDKAEALLAHLHSEGLVTEADERGNRNLVRPGATTESPVAEPTVNDAGLPVDSEGHVIMSDALFEKARGKVVESQEVTKGGLCVAFDLDDEVVKLLLDKLEEEGVISEQDDLGGREVYQKSL